MWAQTVRQLGGVSLITEQQSIFSIMRIYAEVHVTTTQFKNGGWSEKEEFDQAFLSYSRLSTGAYLLLDGRDFHPY